MQPNPWMDIFAYISEHPVSFVGFAAVTYVLIAKGLGAATWAMTLFTAGIIAASSLGSTHFAEGVLTGVIAKDITHAFRHRNGRTQEFILANTASQHSLTKTPGFPRSNRAKPHNFKKTM